MRPVAKQAVNVSSDVRFFIPTPKRRLKILRCNFKRLCHPKHRMSIAGALDRDLPLPLYHQLQGVLKAEIESGKWRPDEQLPNEAKLAERFGVSKITVRQALQELAELGYIRREHGRGTFIARRKFDEGPRELTSFTEEMRRHDLVAASRILGQRVAAADVRVANALRLPARSPVFVLKRVRLADGEPISVQTAH